jgi:hypothetical protein
MPVHALLPFFFLLWHRSSISSCSVGSEAQIISIFGASLQANTVEGHIIVLPIVYKIYSDIRASAMYFD